MNVSRSLLLASAFLSPAAAGQTPLHSFPGTSAHDLHGAATAGSPDLDGDGFGEVIVGAPQADVAGTASGLVRVRLSRGFQATS